jgi:acetyl esterase/lipase
MPIIKEESIHPELRKKARSLYKGSQNFSAPKTKMMKMLCGLLRGRHDKGMKYEQLHIARENGTKLRICVYTPLERKENVPGLLWIHGGGYSIGIPEQDDAFILRFVQASGCVIVSPDYTLSLDKPYPAALDDCYLALLWLRDNGACYGMNLSQLFVGGNSAGGGLAAAVTLLARDKKDVSIAFQMPLYPMMDDRPTKSSTDNHAPLWNSKINDASWKLYLGEHYRSKTAPVYAAPSRAKDYTGLPPACSYIGSLEPFLDETVDYIENLKKCKIPVHFKIYEGCFHAFDQMCPSADISKNAVAFLMESFAYAVKNYFAQQVDKLNPL